MVTRDAGIDTIQAVVRGKIDKDKITNKAIVKKNIRYTLEDDTKLPIIVSLQLGVPSGKRGFPTLRKLKN